MVMAVPARIRVAVDAVDPSPDARVLEVGCGAGVAMALVCERLTDGHVTGLDRSATAIAHAEKRLRRYLDDGVADLQHRDLAGFHGDGRPYDVVFAVNVNVFWTGPAEDETARLRDLVDDAGLVHLVYETPEGADRHRVADRSTSALERARFDVRPTVRDDVLWITATPRGTIA
jgi:protein-L-isoaspartate O-methyltransferase